jgi:NDP-sugar pyrophosphorylase family protein
MNDPSLLEYYFDLSLCEHAELFLEARYPWEIFQLISPYLTHHAKGEILATIPKGAIIIGEDEISIGEGTVIESGAYIQGPCIIGKNCTIRHGAYIRGGVIAGDYCVFGHGTEVKNTLLLNYACIPHLSYVGDSILGNHTNLGAGVKCANLRLDKKLIELKLKNGKIPTGLKKFGLILGDHSSLGCNSVTNPGTLIGKNVQVDPATILKGFIPSHSRVKSNADFMIIPHQV